MILRVGLDARVPRRLVAEYHFPIHHRRALAVARPQVETDPVSFQVAAQRRRRFAFLGHIFEAHAFDGHRPAIDALAHELMIERARSSGRIHRAQKVGQPRLAAHPHPPAAFLPEQEFQQPLGIALVQQNIRAFIRKRSRTQRADGAIGPLERQRKRNAPAVAFHQIAISAEPERGGREVRVEHGPELGRQGKGHDSLCNLHGTPPLAGIALAGRQNAGPKAYSAGFVLSSMRTCSI